MQQLKDQRVFQIRETLQKERRTFSMTVAAAGLCYVASAFVGPTGLGWVAFVLAVGASFFAVLTYVAMSTWELEANLIEGPRVD